ncbi:hypothetical protein CAPTEDRAFT_199134 [Capitella teleta]|uniref:Uncharacterized protein n=1 Tax=Capitella teleta TaxID=283909 RepID=R7VCD7_CAPTE|nr:hypothetical protein CAPTEDRAFT_199134 [Capitella teleta]|eukprot:ELU13981.1 hypothetical protein CAPTEDRAFT_199134 [Capitella teleta]
MCTLNTPRGRSFETNIRHKEEGLESGDTCNDNDEPCLQKKVIWSAILLVAVALMVFQVMNCVEKFLAYPSMTTFVLQPSDPVPLPAVTLCPSQPLRLTEVHKKGWYDILADYSRDPKQKNALSKLNKINVTSRVVYATGGHRIADVLVSCQSESGLCSTTSFSTTLTDNGICFTHNFSSRGLRLLLNPAPYNQFNPHASNSPGCGFRAIFHGTQAFPADTHGSLLLPNGYHSEVQLLGQRVKLLAPPNGQCVNSATPISECAMTCRANDIAGKCGCQPYWMSAKDNSSICNMRRHLTCALQSLGMSFGLLCNSDCNSFKGTDAECNCPSPCLSHKYQGTLSLSQLTDTTYDQSESKINQLSVQEDIHAAENIRARFTPEVLNTDKAQLNKVTRTLDDVIVSFETFRGNLGDSAQSVRRTVDELQPRVKFHLHNALGGLRRTLEHGFIGAWDEVEDKFLKPLANGFHEVMSAYDRSIKQLRFTSTSETIMRKVIFYSTDSELSGKLEIAIQALDNLTKVYYSLLNAEPIVSYAVTPERRYDASLVPFEVLSHYGEQLKMYYNGLSENIAGFIEDCLALKNVLKDVHGTNTLNETANSVAKAKFVEHSRQINAFLVLFRSKIIDKARETIDEKIERMKKMNHTMMSLANDILQETALREHIVNSRYISAYSNLVIFAQKAQLYTSKDAVTKSALAETGLMKSNVDAFMELEGIYGEIADKTNELGDMWRKFKAVVSSLWRTFLSDTSVRDFYFQLYNDVTDMINHPVKIQHFKEIFTHSKMLDISAEDSVRIQPREYYELLNADVAVIDMDTQIDDVDKLFAKWTTRTDLSIVAKGSVGQLLQSFKDLKSNLEDYRRRTTFGKKYFRENFIELHVTMPEVSTSEVVQTSAYSLEMLLRDIGIALLLYLGASLLTFVEFIDVLLSCICRRDTKKKNKRMHRRSPDMPSSVRGTPVIQYETISQQPPKDMLYHSHPVPSHNHVHTKPPDLQYVHSRTLDSGNGNGMMTLPAARKYKEIPPPRVHFANTDI